jgi:hypothetical protein
VLSITNIVQMAHGDVLNGWLVLHAFYLATMAGLNFFLAAGYIDRLCW